MKIDFERTGGFTGIPFKTRIDTNSLSAEQSAELESMVDSAKFFELPSRMVESMTGADRFHYVINIEKEGRNHTVEASDESATPALKSLLRRLTVLARSN